MHKLQRQVASHKTFAFPGSELLQTVTARPWLSRDQCNRAPTNGLWASLPNPPLQTHLVWQFGFSFLTPAHWLLRSQERTLGLWRLAGLHTGCLPSTLTMCWATSRNQVAEWRLMRLWGCCHSIYSPSIHLPQGRGPSFPLLMSPQQFVSLEQVLAVTAAQFQGLGNSTPRLLIW